jgi:CHC2 zinc finger
MIDIQAIKERNPIEQVFAQRFGAVLRKEGAGWVALCPFHVEKTPSCSINVKKQSFKCWGCGEGGDVISAAAVYAGGEAKEWKRGVEFLEGPIETQPMTPSAPSRERNPEVLHERMLPEDGDHFPKKFFKGGQRHFEQIVEVRFADKVRKQQNPVQRLDWQSLQNAQMAGCLRFCVAHGLPAYAILDVENPCNVQVRRMDGEKWFPESAKPKKVKGFGGGWGSWPNGLQSMLADDVKAGVKVPALLVEGTGDFLAAWHVRDSLGQYLAPIVMFGALIPIHAAALSFFHQREVIMVKQHDHGGNLAEQCWVPPLRGAGASVRTWTVPIEGGDLDDYVSAGGDLIGLVATEEAPTKEQTTK